MTITMSFIDPGRIQTRLFAFYLFSNSQKQSPFETPPSPLLHGSGLYLVREICADYMLIITLRVHDTCIFMLRAYLKYV